MESDYKLIKFSKTAKYGFIWRVIFEDNLYQIQRFSPEYRTWFTTKYSSNEDELIKMYDDLGQ